MLVIFIACGILVASAEIQLNHMTLPYAKA